MAWIKTTSDNGTVFSLGHGNSQDEMLLLIAGGTVGIYNHKSVSNFNLRKSSTVVSTGQWVHVVGMLDGGGSPSNLRIFVNGIEETGTTSTVGSPTDIVDTTLRKAIIGWRTNANPIEIFAGQIDEVALFDRALTSGEIQAIFDAGSAGKCKPNLETDLSLSKTDSPDPVSPGVDLTYSVVVTNGVSGAAVATGVIVTDTLPGDVSFKSATPSQGTVDPVIGSDVVWNVGDLASGQSETLEILVTVDPTTLDGTVLTNTAVVDGDQFDPDLSNNTVDELTTVVVPVCTLELTPSYSASTLAVDVLVGTNVAVTANLWGTSQSEVMSLFSGPLAVTEPAVNAAITKSLPPIGTIGVLSTLTLPGLGIICSDFKTVDTSSP